MKFYDKFQQWLNVMIKYTKQENVKFKSYVKLQILYIQML